MDLDTGMDIDVLGADLDEYMEIHLDRVDKPYPEILLDKGLDPQTHVITKAVVKHGGRSEGVTLTVVPTILQAATAREPGPIFPSSVRVDLPEKRCLVLTDHQIDKYDRNLHRLTLDFIREYRPHALVIGGDFLNFDTASKYAPSPKTDTPMQQDINEGYGVLLDYLNAAGTGLKEKVYVEGNHDARMRRHLVNHGMREYAALTRPGDRFPVNSVPHMLRLDELGFEYIDEYPNNHYALSPRLGFHHGWLVRAKAGHTALATLEKLGYSVIVGHTHRQALVSHTVRDIYGNHSVLIAVESGTMATIDQGYDPAQNAQQGFTVVSLFEDGDFSVSLAQYAGRKLFWNGNRWS